ncbi:MAG: VWA domain-containing protein [Gammaproteobacteria bacterium]|nr:VWA domain-containing protein [Gammaproteobacteria bacterium]
MRRRRGAEAFSLSFLDVITCGLGAIILLIMISKPGEPLVLEPAPQSLDGIIADMQEKLFEIRGEARVLNRDLTAAREQLSEIKERVARLAREFGALRDHAAGMEKSASANAARKGELQAALQNLTEEMRRLSARREQVRTDLVGGIPVDSEYVIFVIDTSGSMFQYAWNRVMQEMIGVLEIYPKVKGIQVMDDQGGYMFQDYRGKWIPDSPARRKIILDRLRTWNPFSNSSPVEGIEKAIRTYHEPDRRISIYVFGDDFTGDSVRRVLDEVERLNPKNNDGVPQIRIHAIGFPVQFAAQQQITGARFANLMREMTRKNMGTFVGLNDFRGTREKFRYTIGTPF